MRVQVAQVCQAREVDRQVMPSQNAQFSLSGKKGSTLSSNPRLKKAAYCSRPYPAL